RKKKKQLKKRVKFELLGLLFICLAILGSGAGAISDCAIPSGLENLFLSLFGIWYFVSSLVLLTAGVVLLVKRRYPDFSHKKMIGFYIIFLGVLLLTHIQTFEQLLLLQSDTSILKATWDIFFDYLEGQVSGFQTGGGMTGGILFTFSFYLFSSVGAKIVSIFSIIVGFIFLTEFSVGDFCSNMYQKLRAFILQMKTKYQEKRAVKLEMEEAMHPDKEEKTYDIPSETEEVEPVIQDFTDVAYSNDAIKKETSTHKEEMGEKNADTETDQDSSPLTASENYEYELPSSDLLSEPTHNSQQQEKSQIQATVRKLEKTFTSFGVKARVTKVHVGPAV